ncbi:hypothetical protein DL96DRAFT_1588817 [Flagelloscypha sp. PMI_526]|nr:hypothetical protein DL96DRAFT_1588817 [Flagelloscypha sp. PMI_526]
MRKPSTAPKKRPPVTVVPPEIWLEIAAYLSPRLIRYLASLCKTFSLLAAARRHQSICLPTLPTFRYGRSGLLDMQAVATDIARALKSRVKSECTAQTKHLIFYGLTPPKPVTQRALNNISLSVAARIQWFPLWPWLPELYEYYEGVESLSLLFPAHFYLHEGKLAIRAIQLPKVFELFSGNLRELSISMTQSGELSCVFDSHCPTLPNLETMRFAYHDRHNKSADPGSFLQQVASLYTNQALRELDLRIVYPQTFSDSASFLTKHLLPLNHVFPHLYRFSIGTEWRGGRFELSERERMGMFIRNHAATLRNIRIHKFLWLVEELLSLSPAPTFEQGQPTFSVAVITDLSSWREGPAFQIIRNGIYEAEMREYGVLPEQRTFPNLRRLVFCEKELTLDCFDKVADALPQLISLRIKYEKVVFTSDDIRRRLAESPYARSSSLLKQFAQFSNPSTLAHWGLKDLTLVHENVNGRFPRLPNFALMREVAQLIPSVESFDGQGDMLGVQEIWERLWLWNRNVYTEPLRDKLPINAT